MPAVMEPPATSEVVEPPMRRREELDQLEEQVLRERARRLRERVLRDYEEEAAEE